MFKPAIPSAVAMSSPPGIDPYAVLGVSQEATFSEIRAAHRKRVLKCHPDKIQDESQRNAAQDEFQRVQQAYELLSDETRRARYDQKAKLAELRREVMERRRATDSSAAYPSPRGSGSSAAREYRDGRIYEERMPADAFFDEAMRFTEEPHPMSRKFDEFGMRPKSKGGDEKRKSRTVPVASFRAAKEMARETAKAAHSDRAKHRDKERRRQASEKYERAAYVDSDDGASDSSASSTIYMTKRPEYRRSRESRSRPAESSRRRERRYEDDFSDHWDKLDNLETKVQDYIERSRFDMDRRARMSRSPQRHRGYESAEPESASRRSARATQHRSSSRSYEDLESPRRSYETKTPPRMPTSATSPGLKGSARPTLFSSRSATATAFTRPTREGSSRQDSVLREMAHESVPPQASKLHRYDSGYSSPSTPEMPPRSTSPKTSTRYKIVTDSDPDPPSSKSKHHRPLSPDRAARMPPRRSSTQAYMAEPSPRIEVRPRVERQSSSRPSFKNVEYTTRINDSSVKYTREIRPKDIIYTSPGRSYYYYEHRHPPPARRQSTQA